jgi:hypothetical protein
MVRMMVDDGSRTIAKNYREEPYVKKPTMGFLTVGRTVDCRRSYYRGSTCR